MKQVFETQRALTETVYCEDGSIHVYPSNLVEKPNLTPVNQRGRCETNSDGETHFHPYGKTEKRSVNLFCTPHAMVTRTRKSCVIRFVFPKEMRGVEMTATFIKEARKIGFEMLYLPISKDNEL